MPYRTPARSAPFRHSPGLVLAAVLALAGCGIAVQSHPGGSRASSAPGHVSPSVIDSTPATSPPPVGPRSVAGFRVLSMSFVSDQQGFALGTIRCGAVRCLALLGTPNGGVTWPRL